MSPHLLARLLLPAGPPPNPGLLTPAPALPRVVRRCACCGLACGFHRGCHPKPPPKLAPAWTLDAELVARIRDRDDGAMLDGVRAVAFARLGDTELLLAVAMLSSALVVMNVSQPASPVVLASVPDGDEGFPLLTRAADVAAMHIGGRLIAAVTSFEGNGLQLFDLSDPRRPRGLAVAVHGYDGFTMLKGAHSVTLATVGGKPYAFVTAYTGGGLQIIGLSDPTHPTPSSFIEVPSAQGVAVQRLGDRTLALVAQYDESAVVVVDVTRPDQASMVHRLTTSGNGQSASLNGASAVQPFTVAGNAFVAVAAELGRGIPILNMSEPNAEPVACSKDKAGPLRDAPGATSLAVVAVGGQALALGTNYALGTLAAVDLSNPSDPLHVELRDVAGAGELELRGPLGIAAARPSTEDGAYILAVASAVEDSVNIFRLSANLPPPSPPAPPPPPSPPEDMDEDLDMDDDMGDAPRPSGKRKLGEAEGGAGTGTTTWSVRGESGSQL